MSNSEPEESSSQTCWSVPNLSHNTGSIVITEAETLTSLRLGNDVNKDIKQSNDFQWFFCEKGAGRMLGSAGSQHKKKLAHLVY